MQWQPVCSAHTSQRHRQCCLSPLHRHLHLHPIPIAIPSEKRPLLFNRRWIYAVAAVCDVVLRFVWTLSLVPLASNPFFVSAVGDDVYQNLLMPLLVGLEIIRRMVWACFRVENEHVGHVDE